MKTYNQLITDLQEVKEDIKILRETREYLLAKLYRCPDNEVSYFHSQLRHIDKLTRNAKGDRKQIITQLEMTLDVNGAI